jgi:chorismate mutase
VSASSRRRFLKTAAGPVWLAGGLRLSARGVNQRKAPFRLLAIVNQRIRKVAELRRYKDTNGIVFVDREREAWLADYLKRLNRGPLSDGGVSELMSFVLALVKREVARG